MQSCLLRGTRVAGLSLGTLACRVPNSLCTQTEQDKHPKAKNTEAGSWVIGGVEMCELGGCGLWGALRVFCKAQGHCGNNYGQGLIFSGGTRLSVQPRKYGEVGAETSLCLRPGSIVTLEPGWKGE